MKNLIIALAFLPSFAFSQDLAVNSCTSWRNLQGCKIDIGTKYNAANIKAALSDGVELGAKISENSNIGIYNFDVTQAGIYDVKVSAKAWIDVFQDGQKLKSAGFSEPKDNGWVFKIVRFNLENRKATLVVSGAVPENISLEIVKE